MEAFTIVANADGTTFDATLKNPGCVSCIMLGGAWCSGVWAFAATGAYKNPVAPDGTNKVDQAANNDLGQCCWKADKTKQEAVQGQTAAQLGAIEDNVWAKTLCPAMWPNTAYVGVGQAAIGLGKMAKIFWCSNGWTSKKNVADVVTTNWKNYAVNPVGKSDNQIIVDLKDFYLVLCRQRVDMCGSAAVALSSTTKSAKRPINYVDKAAAGGAAATAALLSGEKCSFLVDGTLIGAPTFSVANLSTAGTNTMTNADKSLNDNAPGWIITYIEWIGDTMNASAATDSGTSTDSANISGVGFPAPEGDTHWAAIGSAATSAVTMIDKVKSRHYSDAAEWVNGVQEYPLARRVLNYASAVTATRDANKAQWRYFDVHSADLALNSYTARTTAFATLSSAYNTDATAYNTALADYEKAMAVDAFTAFFSPPKAVKVPTRPNVPDQPSAFDQYAMASKYEATYETAAWTTYITGKDTVIEQRTWMPAANFGGWGEVSTGQLSVLSGTGKSFGTFGSSVALADATKTTAANQYIYGSFAAYKPAAMNFDTCVTTVGPTQSCQTKAAATDRAYMVVTLLPSSFSTAAFSATNGNVEFTFSTTAWRTTGSFQQPAQPAAATPALSTPKGAQALAVSASLALAMAALY